MKVLGKAMQQHQNHYQQAAAESGDDANTTKNSSHKSQHLHTLVLDGNPIGNKGAVAIGCALPYCPSLTALSVAACDIGCAGAVKLLTGHRGKRTQLQRLVLHRNRVNEREVSLQQWPIGEKQ